MHILACMVNMWKIFTPTCLGEFFVIVFYCQNLLPSSLSLRSTTPTKFTFLKSEIRPEGCGDTLFSDSQSAYEAIAEETKLKLKGMRASYSYLKHRIVDAGGSTEGLTEVELEAAKNPTIHPIVTVHPITGKKNIFANPSHTVAILDIPRQESDDLLNFLYSHVAEERFLYNHIWQDDDFVMWDNRGECNFSDS